MNKIDFHFDFETRSHLNLKKVGAVKYAAHKTTQATLLTWAFGRTGKVKAWRIGEAIPDDLDRVLYSPEKYNFIAWNIEFDYMIWTIPFRRQADHPRFTRPQVKDLTDAMALSQQFRTGAGLEACARMLNIPISKDKAGRRIMLKQCKPSSKTNMYPVLTTEEWADFERYGIIDTVILREAYYRLPQLSAAERWIFEWTLTRNLKGIRLDTDLIKVMSEIITANMPILEKEFADITGGLKIKSVKAKEWFLPHFPWIENMRSDTVREMQLRCDGVNPLAVRALEIKALAGSTSISKVPCAVNMELNGRIYGLLAYHMAQTKRFAGRGIQIHNFPRPSYKAADQLPKDLNVKDLTSIVRAAIPALQDPIGYVKNLLRRMWIADEGMMIYCGDFSKVEPTMLRWLTGMGPISATAYEEMAMAIYSLTLDQISKDSEERQVGKAATLGGGYGMGHVKFMDDTKSKTGIVLTKDFSKHVIDTYRKENAPITQFWRDLQGAFRKAIGGQGSKLCDGKVFVMPMQPPFQGVQIKLPSGSYLYYHKATVTVETEMVDIVEIVNGVSFVRQVPRVTENLYYTTQFNGFPTRTKIYGGLLCEHVTSAVSRDLLTHSMYNLDQAGFDILTSVHDEIWGQQVPGLDELFTSTMCKLPYWCLDVVVTADGENGVRYLK